MPVAAVMGESTASWQKERWATAYHEAGHVVAFWQLHRPIESVTIVPGVGSLGRVTNEPDEDLVQTVRTARFSPSSWRTFSPGDVGAVLDGIIRCLSGPLAEFRYRKVQVWLPRSDCDDLREARMYARALAGCADDDGDWGDLEGECAALLEWSELRTERLIGAHWGSVACVARALYRKKTLSGEEAFDLCVRAMCERLTVESAALPPRLAGILGVS